MQLKTSSRMVTGAFANIYTQPKRKGDRPRHWSFASKKKRKPGAVVVVPVARYMEQQGEQSV